MKLRQIKEPTPSCPRCKVPLNEKEVHGFGTKYRCIKCGAEYVQEVELLNPFTEKPIDIRHFIAKTIKSKRKRKKK